MKLKRIKDNEVVVDGKEYAKLVRFEHDFFEMQYAIYDGNKPMFTAVTDLDCSNGARRFYNQHQAIRFR